MTARLLASLHDGGRYEIIPIEVGDRRVVVISVARREQGFAQTVDGQVVVRCDAMNTALIGTQLADFVTRHALARFETTPTSCPSDVADAVLVAKLVQAYGWSVPVSERLIEWGLVTRDGGRDVLTVTGALYLLREPERELGRSYIEVFRYRDGAATTEDKRYRITGLLRTKLPKRQRGSRRRSAPMWPWSACTATNWNGSRCRC